MQIAVLAFKRLFTSIVLQPGTVLFPRAMPSTACLVGSLTVKGDDRGEATGALQSLQAAANDAAKPRSTAGKGAENSETAAGCRAADLSKEVDH